MQDTKKPRTLNATDNWLLSHASALVSYAASDEAFAESLATHVRERNWRHTEIDITPRTSIYLWPKDRTAAVQNAHWLLTELDRRPDAIYTKGMLATYALEFESPQDVVLGIVGIAIIGPTLGLIQKKKKKKSHLSIVIDDTWLKTHSQRQLVSLSLELAHSVIADELRLAAGDAYRLHPDTAAWCLEEPLTKLYSSSKANLKRIKSEATVEALPHQLKGGAAIAFSPAVDDDFLTQFKIKALE